MYYSSSKIHEIEKEVNGSYKIEKVCDDKLIGINIESKERVSFTIVSDLFYSYYSTAKFLQNLQVSSKLNHENIIRILNLKNYDKSLIIVSETLDTDLLQVIHSQQELSEDHRRYFIYQILRGLKYLHSANYIHNYLKPSKIEVTASCDIKIQTVNTDMLYEDIVSCRWYKAPEILLESDEKFYSSDIWSVGCILYELIMREKPLFTGSSTIDQINKIVERIGSPKNEDLFYLNNSRSLNYMNSLPKVQEVEWNELIQRGTKNEIELIKMMLTWNPAKRISVEEALKHSYFDDLHDPSDEPCTSPIDAIDISHISQYEVRPNLQTYFWNEIKKIRKDLI